MWNAIHNPSKCGIIHSETEHLFIRLISKGKLFDVEVEAVPPLSCI